MSTTVHTQTVLMILGPTASGKTALSYSIAQELSSEIINVDVGQFYKSLSIGTAKPDLTDSPCPLHLFDVLDEPEDLTVSRYRELVIEQVHAIHGRAHQAILVGGSLFYIKSLFFPPAKSIVLPTTPAKEYKQYDEHASTQELWKILCSIDPDRAQAIHPHDVYRIKRALDIWYTTGQKPSTFVPQFTSPFTTHIVYLSWPRELLRERINMRMRQMFDEGWIEEAEQLINTPWESFLCRKGLIGYSEIFAWLRNGKQSHEKEKLIETIYYETIHYAKRQETFAKSLFGSLERHRHESASTVSTQFITSFDEEAVESIIHYLTK
jgi:tRNA dimethylallyltransferase